MIPPLRAFGDIADTIVAHCEFDSKEAEDPKKIESLKKLLSIEHRKLFEACDKQFQSLSIAERNILTLPLKGLLDTLKPTPPPTPKIIKGVEYWDRPIPTDCIPTAEVRDKLIDAARKVKALVEDACLGSIKPTLDCLAPESVKWMVHWINEGWKNMQSESFASEVQERYRNKHSGFLFALALSEWLRVSRNFTEVPEVWTIREKVFKIIGSHAGCNLLETSETIKCDPRLITLVILTNTISTPYYWLEYSKDPSVVATQQLFLGMCNEYYPLQVRIMKDAMPYLIELAPIDNVLKESEAKGWRDILQNEPSSDKPMSEIYENALFAITKLTDAKVRQEELVAFIGYAITKNQILMAAYGIQFIEGIENRASLIDKFDKGQLKEHIEKHKESPENVFVLMYINNDTGNRLKQFEELIESVEVGENFREIFDMFYYMIMRMPPEDILPYLIMLHRIKEYDLMSKLYSEKKHELIINILRETPSRT